MLGLSSLVAVDDTLCHLFDLSWSHTYVLVIVVLTIVVVLTILAVLLVAHLVDLVLNLLVYSRVKLIVTSWLA